jgi:hypothetical protein
MRVGAGVGLISRAIRRRSLALAQGGAEGADMETPE